MKDELNVLTGIKGIGSVVIAFFFHWNHFVPTHSHPLYFIKGIDALCLHGWLAVELFFLISGVTFTTLYLEKVHNRKVTGMEFAVLRISRLWPIHFFTCCIVALVQMIRAYTGLGYFKFVYNDFYNFILNIFMVHAFEINNGAGYNWVSWSISVNIFLYFLFYTVAKKAKSNSSILSISAALVIFGLYIIKNNKFLFFGYNIGRGLVAFFWGVIFAITYKTCFAKSEKTTNTLWGIALIVCLFVSLFLDNNCSDNSNLLAAAICITYFTIILFFSLKCETIKKITSSSVLMTLGNMSFSIYMLHYPIQLILKTTNDLFSLALDFTRLKVWVSFVLIVLGCSYFSAKYIEKPLSDFIRKEFYKSYSNTRISIT